MNKKLVVYHGDLHAYVEGFSKECKRHKEGSIHICKGKAITLTDDEYEHIKANYKELMPDLKIVARDLPEKKVVKKEETQEKPATKKEDAKIADKKDAKREEPKLGSSYASKKADKKSSSKA